MKSKLSHLMAQMWKVYGLEPDKFMSSWLPFILLMQHRYYELYVKDDKKDPNRPDADDMNIDQLKSFFLQAGIKVKED